MILNDMTLIEMLTEAGAVYERREDSHGITRTGWWMDGFT